MGWKKQLAPDEVIVADLRAHPKALALPIIFLFALAAACGFLIAVMPSAMQPWSTWVILVIGLGLAIAFVVRPVIDWATTHFAFTDRRLVVHTGLIRRRRSDLAFNRITDVSYDRKLLDRLMGSGTLVLTTVAGSRLRLDGLPKIVVLQQAVSQLVFETRVPGPETPA